MTSPSVTVELVEVTGVVTDITSYAGDIGIATVGAFTGPNTGGSCAVGFDTAGLPTGNTNQCDVGNFNGPGGDASGNAGTLATGPFPNHTGWNSSPWNDYNTATPIGAPWINAVTYGYHTNGSNVLLCDGHVKFLQAAKISIGRDAPSHTTAETAGVAAGTDNLINMYGNAVTVTFSPI